MVDRVLIEQLGVDDQEAELMVAQELGQNVADGDLDGLVAAQIGELQVGSILKGKIVGQAGDSFLVEVGLKSEGLLDKDEFDDPSSVETGDVVEVLLEEMESEQGTVQISKRRADRIRIWERLTSTKNENDQVTGKVMRKIKGGLLVDIGVPVFLPASQVDIRRPADIGAFIGKEIDAQIVKIDTDRRNIVITRQRNYAPTGAEVAHSFDEALRLAGDADCFIGGGEEIYRLAMPVADRLYLTVVHTEVDGHVHFPAFDWVSWRLSSEEHHWADERHAHIFTFQIWERVHQFE